MQIYLSWNLIDSKQEDRTMFKHLCWHLYKQININIISKVIIIGHCVCISENYSYFVGTAFKHWTWTRLGAPGLWCWSSQARVCENKPLFKSASELFGSPLPNSQFPEEDRASHFPPGVFFTRRISTHSSCRTLRSSFPPPCQSCRTLAVWRTSSSPCSYGRMNTRIKS